MNRDALWAGCFAGVAVDVSLFPLDTLKTRAQSADGFFQAGGFRGVYQGLKPAALGSAPTAALFFYTYESLKLPFASLTNSTWLSHCMSASVAELSACLIRVPTDNLKQNMQASKFPTLIATFRGLTQQRGSLALYHGILPTLTRDIPFAFIQFPLYEALKLKFGQVRDRPCTSIESAACGSLAGGIAASITCPLDVAKTRSESDRILPLKSSLTEPCSDNQPA